MSAEWTPRPVWLDAPQRIMTSLSLHVTCEATNQLSTRLFYRESSLFPSNRGGRRRGVAMVSATFFYCRLWTREARAGGDSCKQAESEEREPVRARRTDRWVQKEVFVHLSCVYSEIRVVSAANNRLFKCWCLCPPVFVSESCCWEVNQAVRTLLDPWHRHSCNNTKLLLTHWTAGFSPWLRLPEQMVRAGAWAHLGLVLLSLCLCVQSVPISVDLPREELEPPQGAVSDTRPPSDTNRVSDRGTGLTQSAYVRGFAQNKQRAKWHTCSL